MYERLAMRWRVLLGCTLLPTKSLKMLSILAEKDIWAPSDTEPMRTTCGCCRTIATANQKSQTHTHTHTTGAMKIHKSPITQMRSCITHLLGTAGLGGCEGKGLNPGGIRGCLIQHVLSSLSVALIYTIPPSHRCSAVCESRPISSSQ